MRSPFSLFSLFSLRRFALLVTLVVVAFATGCSSGSSSSGSGATPDITGAYVSKSAEPGYAWMSFYNGDQYIAFYNSPGCDAAQAPASCGSFGTYTVDGDTLTLDDESTNTTKSMPLSVQMRAAQAATLVKDLQTSEVASLVTDEGSVVQPESLTIGSGSGAQQLVPSAGTQSAGLVKSCIAAAVACSLLCNALAGAEGPPHIETPEPAPIPIEQPVAACGSKPT